MKRRKRYMCILAMGMSVIMAGTLIVPGGLSIFADLLEENFGDGDVINNPWADSVETTTEEITTEEPTTQEITNEEPTIADGDVINNPWADPVETTTEEITTEEPTTEEPTTEEPQADEDFVIAKKSLALTNGLRVYFKVEKALFNGRYSDPKLVITFNGVETEITEYDVDGDYYQFAFNDIAPHQMKDTIYAKLIATKDGKEFESPVVEYSVATYCYNTLDKYAEDAELRTLLVDLLNYGAASQTYVPYKTDDLVNGELTNVQKAWGTSDVGILTTVRDNAYETIDNPTATWKSPALNLRASVVIRMKLRAASIDGMAVKVTDEDKDKGNEWTIESEDFEYEGVDKDTGEPIYNVYFDQFTVGRLSDSFYFKIYQNGKLVSNTYRYSVESYAQARVANPTDESLTALMVAMMKYGKAAKAYVS